MEVVYNSGRYSVLAYPAQEGYELVDKDAKQMLFLHGVHAHNFFQAINELPPEERSEETIDAFLERYGSGRFWPIVFQ